MLSLLCVKYDFMILQPLYSVIFTSTIGVSYVYPHLIKKKPKA